MCEQLTKKFASMAGLAKLGQRFVTTRTSGAPTAALCWALARAPVAGKSFSTTAAAKAAGDKFASAGDIAARTGLDPTLYTNRTVRIFKPARSPTQSGPHSGLKWELAYAPRPLPLLHILVLYPLLGRC